MPTVTDLHAFYGKSHILNGVDRSTTVKAIMGDMRAHGSVRFRDEEVCGLPPYVIARKGLGYVPENRDIFPPSPCRRTSCSA
jgi:branched-chain amino acid transport system ATP-binding protein